MAYSALAIIRQHIIFSLAVKALFVVLTFGVFASLWGAIVADAGASLLVVFNGLRLLGSLGASSPAPSPVGMPTAPGLTRVAGPNLLHTTERLTMNSGKEIAKFACGFETFHAIVHAYLWYTGTTVTMLGITATPTLNIVGLVLNAALALAFHLRLAAFAPVCLIVYSETTFRS